MNLTEISDKELIDEFAKRGLKPINIDEYRKAETVKAKPIKAEGIAITKIKKTGSHTVPWTTSLDGVKWIEIFDYETGKSEKLPVRMPAVRNINKKLQDCAVLNAMLKGRVPVNCTITSERIFLATCPKTAEIIYPLLVPKGFTTVFKGKPNEIYKPVFTAAGGKAYYYRRESGEESSLLGIITRGNAFMHGSYLFVPVKDSISFSWFAYKVLDKEKYMEVIKDFVSTRSEETQVAVLASFEK